MVFRLIYIYYIIYIYRMSDISEDPNLYSPLVKYDKLLLVEPFLGSKISKQKTLFGLSKNLSDKLKSEPKNFTKQDKKAVELLELALLNTQLDYQEDYQEDYQLDNMSLERDIQKDLNELGDNVDKCKAEFNKSVKYEINTLTANNKYNLNQPLSPLFNYVIRVIEKQPDKDEGDDIEKGTNKKQDTKAIEKTLKKTIHDLEEEQRINEGTELNITEDSLSKSSSISIDPVNLTKVRSGIKVNFQNNDRGDLSTIFGQNSETYEKINIYKRFNKFKNLQKTEGQKYMLEKCDNTKTIANIFKKCNDGGHVQGVYNNIKGDMFKMIREEDEAKENERINSLCECLKPEIFINIFEYANKKYTRLINNLIIIYCKSFHAGKDNLLNNSYTQGIRNNTIQKIDSLTKCISARLDELSNVDDSLDSDLEIAKSIQNMTKGLKELQDEINIFKEKIQGSDSDSDFYSFMNKLLNKKGIDSETLDDFISRHNIHYHIFYEINFSKGDSDKYIDEKIKELKTDLLKIYKKSCNQTLFYFNFKLLDTLKYDNSTRKFLESYDSENVERDEKLMKIQDINKNINKSRLNKYLLGNIHRHKDSENVILENFYEKEDNGYSYYKLITDMYDAFVEDINSKGIMEGGNVYSVLKELNELENKLSIQKQVLKSMQNFHFNTRDRKVSQEKYYIEESKVSDIKKEIKTKKIELKRLKKDGHVPSRENLQEIMWMIEHFEKVKEYFGAFNDISFLLDKEKKYDVLNHPLNREANLLGDDKNFEMFNYKSKGFFESSRYLLDGAYLAYVGPDKKREYYLNMINKYLNGEMIRRISESRSNIIYFSSVYQVIMNYIIHSERDDGVKKIALQSGIKTDIGGQDSGERVITAFLEENNISKYTPPSDDQKTSNQKSDSTTSTGGGNPISKVVKTYRRRFISLYSCDNSEISKKLEQYKEELSKKYEKIKEHLHSKPFIFIEDIKAKVLIHDIFIDGRFCSKVGHLKNNFEACGKVFGIVSTLVYPFESCENTFVEESIEAKNIVSRTKYSIVRGVTKIYKKTVYMLKAVLLAITSLGISSVKDTIVSLFKFIKKIPEALYFIGKDTLKFIWNYFIKYSRPGIFLKRSMKKTWNGIKNIKHKIGGGIKALYESISKNLGSISLDFLPKLFKRRYNLPEDRDDTQEDRDDRPEESISRVMNESEAVQVSKNHNSTLGDPSVNKVTLELLIADDEKKIHEDIIELQNCLNLIKKHSWNGENAPDYKYLITKITDFELNLSKNNVFGSSLRDSFLYNVENKKESLRFLQNYGKTQYIEIVFMFSDLPHIKENYKDMSEYKQFQTVYTQFQTLYRPTQILGGAFPQVTDPNLRSVQLTDGTPVTDVPHNAVWAASTPVTIWTLVTWTPEIRYIYRSTYLTYPNIEKNAFLLEQTYIKDQAAKVIEEAEKDKFAEKINSFASPFSRFSSVDLSGHIESLRDEYYLDKHEFKGISKDDIKKLREIDNRGKLHQHLKKIIKTPDNRIKKIEEISNALSSLNYNEIIDIGKKIKEKLNEGNGEYTKANIISEIVEEIVKTIAVIVSENSEEDIKPEIEKLKQEIENTENEKKAIQESIDVARIEKSKAEISVLEEEIRISSEEEKEGLIKQLQQKKEYLKEQEEIKDAKKITELEYKLSTLREELDKKTRYYETGGDIEFDKYERNYSAILKSLAEYSYNELSKAEEKQQAMKDAEGFFTSFQSSLESIGSSKGSKFFESLTGIGETLGQQKARLEAEISSIKKKEGESDGDLAARKQGLLEKLEGIKGKITDNEKKKQNEKKRIENQKIDAVTTRDAVTDPIPEEETITQGGILKNKRTTVNIDESQNQVRFIENQVRFIEDQSITDPKYVESYNQTRERFKKMSDIFDNNSEKYQSIISLSREYLTLNPRNRRISDNSVKRYYDEVKWLSDKFYTYKSDVQVNIDTLESILNVYSSSQKSKNKKGGASSSNILTKQIVSDFLNKIKMKRSEIEGKINKLEDILDQLNRIFKVGQKKDERELEKYKDIIKEFNNIRGNDRNYSNYEFKRICSIMDKGFGRSSKLDSNKPSHKEIINGLKKISEECNSVKRKQKEKEIEDKKKIEEGKRKKKEEEKINNERKKLEEERKKFQESKAQRPSQPGQQPRPSQPGQQPRPSQPGQQPSPSKPGQQPRPSQPGQQPRPSQPGQQSTKPGEVTKDDSISLQSFNKKPNVLNMGKDLDGKIGDITKRQGSELVIPPKDKLKELSRVMNNDKLIDIIRNKNFSEFSDKEVKDVDIVRDRFNKFVNDYYQLLDMFYDYKKNKERGEKEDILMILKQEKQIEQLKNIVLEYKTNLEKFKNACEVKTEQLQIENIKDSEKKEKEFKDVFSYMQGLFKEELKEEKKATKENTRILKEENDLQKEKILLLEDKKKKSTPKKKKLTPKKKNDRTPKKKNDRTPKKKNDRTPKKKNDRTPKKKNDRTPKKGRK